MGNHTRCAERASQDVIDGIERECDWQGQVTSAWGNASGGKRPSKNCFPVRVHPHGHPTGTPSSPCLIVRSVRSLLRPVVLGSSEDMVDSLFAFAGLAFRGVFEVSSCR